MLGSIRKFSTSIYAKILLGIIIIPFVFWGMGTSFGGGDKNILVTIDKEKYSIQDFANFVQKFLSPNQKMDENKIQEYFTVFIGDKLIQKEVEHFNIRLSDNSLGKLIKHQKVFKRDNKFSRTEYEKFLLENDITHVNFESNLSQQERKQQLLNFIGGGIFPSKFLVDETYSKINQKMNIEVINLNDLFMKKLNFNDDDIKSHFENNKNLYSEIFKSLKLIELNPKKLVGVDEYNDLFFKKIDEIDDLIIQGENFNNIIKRFNFDDINTITINKLGKDINSVETKNVPKSLILNIFNIDESEFTSLIEIKNKYYIVEVIKTENIQKKIHDLSVQKEIITNLEKITKRKLISEIITKVNTKNFTKLDFDKLSKDENVPIAKARLDNKNDEKFFKKSIVDQVYMYPEGKVIVVHDINLSENFIVYIDKIKNVSIDRSSADYEKYVDLSEIKIMNRLYNTYNDYIKKKYEIDINYQALDTVKNYLIN